MHAGRRRALAGGAALLAAAAAGAGLWSRNGKLRAQDGERVVKVVARKFVFLPSEIELRRDEPVVLELTAVDAVMGFNAPHFKLRADIVPGVDTRVRLTPSEPGTFVFLCDVFCGDGHETMAGKLIVT